ncbi:U3 snoRNP protein [Kickxella alabastrina]|uniref:U3 snoRNP protein n=1 Tax=Kickxella alabastrina TaxID=61397 RepID=A0ACC1IP32_9FUNG|nr:U3 snoRNP protein [Kickxella alabastrina]
MAKKNNTSKSQRAAKAGKPAAQATNASRNLIPDSFIEQFIDHPGAFIVPDAKARAAAMDVVGRTYDAANFSDKFGLFDDWKSVLDSGFDSNLQLWELISIRNEPVLKYSADVMKELSALIDSVNIDSESESDEDEAMLLSGAESAAEDENDVDALLESGSEADSSDLESDDVENSSDSDKSAGDASEGENDDEEEYYNSKPSVLDDEFFSVAEMERFADEADEEDMRDRAILAGDYPKPKHGEKEDDDESSESDEDDIDLFQDLDKQQGFNDDGSDMDDDDESDEEGVRPDEMKYADFFLPPKDSKRGVARASREKHAKRVKFDPKAVGSDDDEKDQSKGSDNDEAKVASARKSNLFDDDDDEDEEDDVANNKSEFEKRQEKLQGLISKLEDEAVEKKDWTMIGEVNSATRPKNSLLGEDLEFDHVQKPVPVVTQEATQTLEDIIKRRIISEQWDDVERKKDIQAKPFRPSEFIELNDKASKKSLAEVYEEDYLAKKAGDDYVPENDAKVTESHKEVDNQFRDLFAQLDALSHFHFAPRPATVDIEIRTNAPALHMEEKLPVNMSQAAQLAPEEIYEKSQGRNGRTGDLMGETEMTREDRNTRRLRKKHAQKKKSDAIAEVKGISKTAAAAAKAAKTAKTPSADKTKSKSKPKPKAA